MADQRRVQPIGMLRGQEVKVQGMTFLVNFVILRMKDEGSSYLMLLGRPWFKTAKKLKQDWEENEVILKKGKHAKKIPMITRRRCQNQ